MHLPRCLILPQNNLSVFRRCGLECWVFWNVRVMLAGGEQEKRKFSTRVKTEKTTDGWPNGTPTWWSWKYVTDIRSPHTGPDAPINHSLVPIPNLCTTPLPSVVSSPEDLRPALVILKSIKGKSDTKVSRSARSSKSLIVHSTPDSLTVHVTSTIDDLETSASEELSVIDERLRIRHRNINGIGCADDHRRIYCGRFDT